MEVWTLLGFLKHICNLVTRSSGITSLVFLVTWLFDKFCHNCIFFATDHKLLTLLLLLHSPKQITHQYFICQYYKIGKFLVQTLCSTFSAGQRPDSKLKPSTFFTFCWTQSVNIEFWSLNNWSVIEVFVNFFLLINEQHVKPL